MSRNLVLLFVVSALACVGRDAVSANPPTVGEDLRLAACGKRTMLWMELYAVALYLPPAEMGRDAIEREDVPKAIRIEPTYPGELPSDLPGDWRRRVEGKLPPDQMALLRQLFARMTSEDVATIVYRPGDGTVLTIGDAVVGRTEDGQLIHAVLDIWLDPDYPLDLSAEEC